MRWAALALALGLAACGARPAGSALTLDRIVRGDTELGSDTHTPPCAHDDGSPDARYRFRAPHAGRFAIRAAGELDLVLTVRDASGAVLGCRQESAPRSGAEVALDLGAGAEVEVVVDGDRGDRGRHRVHVADVLAATGGGALALGERVTGDTRDAGPERTHTHRLSIGEGALYQVTFEPEYSAWIGVRVAGSMRSTRAASPGERWQEVLGFHPGEVEIEIRGVHEDDAGRYALRVDRADRARPPEDAGAVAHLYEAAEELVAGSRAVLLSGPGASVAVPSCGIVDGRSEAVLRLDLEAESSVSIVAESFAGFVLELRGAPPAPAVIGCVHDAESGERRRLERRLPPGRYYVILDASADAERPLAIALTTRITPIASE